MFADRVITGIERGGKALMHAWQVIPRDDNGLIPPPPVQLNQLLVRQTRFDRRPGNLVAIEVQDRQHGTVPTRVEKVHTFPAAFQRTGFSFPITYDAGHQQVGIVEDSAKGVHQRIAQLSAFMQGVGCVRAAMAGDAAGGGEAAKEAQHALFIGRDVGVHLAISTFQPGAGVHGRAAMAWTGDENRLDAPVANQAIEVHIDKVLPDRRAPVPQQSRLDVLGQQRLAQQRIGL